MTGPRPFVGRELEWARLGTLLTRALLGDGQVVRVQGERGIGKSRLRDELALVLRRRGVEILEARAPDPTHGGALGPFRELIGRTGVTRAGLTPTEAAVLDEILIPRAGRDDPAATRRGTANRSDLAYRADGRGRAELASAFVKVLVAPARLGAPRAIVLEDFQLADDASRALLGALGPAVRERPVLVLVLERGATGAGDAGETIALGPLDEADARRLLSELFGSEATARSAAADAAIDRAAGNPLFLREIILAWAADGTLRRDGAGWRVAGDATPRPPASIDEAIAGRIACLPAATRRVLAEAAVLGRAFPTEVLRQVERELHGTGAEVLAAILAELEAHDLLASTADDHLGFVDVVVGEVALALAGTAAAVHREAARAYEAAVDAGALVTPETLAFHWAAAGEERRAVRFVVEAADRSRAAFDHDRAVALYRRALDTIEVAGATADGVRAQLQERLGDELLIAGEYARAAEAFRAARGRGDAAVDEVRRLHKLATVAQKAGRYAEALVHCQDALRRDPAPRTTAALEALAALTCAYDGQLDAAHARVQRGQAVLAAAPEVTRAERLAIEAALHRADGNVLLGLGRPGAAAAAYQKGLAACEELGDRWETSIALYNAGDAWLVAGRTSIAQHFLRRALTEKEAIGDGWGLAYTRQALALVHLEEGDPSRAWQEVVAGLRAVGSRGDPKITAMLRIAAARVRLALGEPRSALDEADAALVDAEALGARLEIGAALVVRADALRALDDPVAAITAARRAHALAAECGAPRAAGEALLAWGHAARAAGDVTAGRDRYLAALRVAGALSDPRLRAAALAALSAE